MRAATRGHSRGQPGDRDFNPRGPCGPRRDEATIGTDGSKFQSTRPVRAATQRLQQPVAVVLISIHAARAGRDRPYALYYRYSIDFNPRGPCGPRHALNILLESDGKISIHAARAGRDGLGPLQSCADKSNFNPRGPCGPRRCCRVP